MDFNTIYEMKSEIISLTNNDNKYINEINSMYENILESNRNEILGGMAQELALLPSLNKIQKDIFNRCTNVFPTINYSFVYSCIDIAFSSGNSDVIDIMRQSYERDIINRIRNFKSDMSNIMKVSTFIKATINIKDLVKETK